MTILRLKSHHRCITIVIPYDYLKTCPKMIFKDNGYASSTRALAESKQLVSPPKILKLTFPRLLFLGHVLVLHKSVVVKFSLRHYSVLFNSEHGRTRYWKIKIWINLIFNFFPKQCYLTFYLFLTYKYV